MARGWESKAIESQQDEAARQRERTDHRSDTQRAADARRHDLALTRARVVTDLERATHPEHREMLTRALDALDLQIRATES